MSPNPHSTPSKEFKNLAVLRLAHWMREYDRCNPDVESGWWWNHFIGQAITELGLTKDEVDYVDLVNSDPEVRKTS